MELKEPKSKSSKCRLEPKSSLPLVFGNKGELTKFHGSLTALGSCIADPIEIQMIYKMGYFGKGSLSKSHPSFGRIQHGAPAVTRKRQWQRRQEWIGQVEKLSAETFYAAADNDSQEDDQSNLQAKLLVLSDSDSETDCEYLINIRPEIKHENFPVREALHLTAEETFFLVYGLGCLRLVDFDGKYLSIGQIWNYFCKEQKTFLQKYVAYHYFRSKGWVVKAGLSYGGDYLLYKEGPAFYHSSYIVIIDVLDAASLKRIEAKSMRSMTWNNMIGLQRLAETVGKEVLLAQVLWPASVAIDAVPGSPEILSQFTVREILWKRWKLSVDTFSDTQDWSDLDDYSS